jgi:hypothetical protein
LWTNRNQFSMNNNQSCNVQYNQCSKKRAFTQGPHDALDAAWYILNANILPDL